MRRTDFAPLSFAEMAAAMRQRMEEEGYTWLKMDFGIRQAKDYDTQVINNKFWSTETERAENRSAYMSYNNRQHPFTQIQLSDKAIEGIAEYVDAVRSAAGYEVPLASDHYGHFDYNNHIRLFRALDKYRLAWCEDPTQWYNFDDLRRIKNAIETPVCTGEDIFCLRGPGTGLGFKDLIDAKCVDLIHPDLATSGGILENKRIADYAQENNIAAAFHQAGTPVTFMANVHCAAASENFLALEHHATNDPNWEKLVKVTGSQPMITKGFGNVPLDSPGLGIELIDDAIKEFHANRYQGVFGEMWAPTDYWNNRQSNDRIWS
jgi:L-alanine-DL-glutamate epimerase-like enolase superfamily enzyme